jgi:very-short-patch-repair endonuclease
LSDGSGSSPVQCERAQRRPEARLWFLLRDGRLDGLKFRRQVPIGSAIVDFVCFDRNLIVEADGSQHLASPEHQSRDAELRRRGFRVLRFWNNDVLADSDAVMETIRRVAVDNP